VRLAAFSVLAGYAVFVLPFQILSFASRLTTPQLKQVHKFTRNTTLCGLFLDAR
jgi:hypothetical protein